MANPIPDYLQPGVYSPPGSDLYNQRQEWNATQARKAGATWTGSIPGQAGVETGLASSVNTFMQGQAEMPFLMNLPNYKAMQGQQSQNILSMLQGDVPTDVINQILQQAAERGIATGSPRGPNANAAYLKALGLTSLDMMGKGSQLFGQAIEQTPRAELWNPMSLYVPERLAKQELSAAKEGAGQGGYSGWMSSEDWLARNKPGPTTTTGWGWGF